MADTFQLIYDGISKIFRADAVKNPKNKNNLL
jgi:hypothetical protein